MYSQFEGSDRICEVWMNGASVPFSAQNYVSLKGPSLGFWSSWGLVSSPDAQRVYKTFLNFQVSISA